MFKQITLSIPFFVLLSLITVSCNNNSEVFTPAPEEDAAEQIERPRETPLPPTRLTLTEAEMKNIPPSNDYIIRFFKDHYESDADMLLSPLGFQLTLAMVGNVVKDKKSVCEMLGFGAEDMNEVNTYFRHLIEALSSDRFSDELKIANAFMTDIRAKKYPEGFLDLLKSHYHVESHEIEAQPLFKLPIGKRPEDVWCQEKTDGIIKTAPFPILEAHSALLNSFLFKGEWQDKFDKELTKCGLFHVSSDSSIFMSFMNKETKTNFYRGNDFTSLTLPFGDGAFDMTIILPEAIGNVPGILGHLDSESWGNIRNGFEFKETRISIPIFSASYLMRMVFDFEFIEDVMPFSLIGQSASFTMNEEGVSAAAVTQAITPTYSGPSGKQEIESFIANRPFLFIISEAGSGLILFIGQFTGQQ